VPPFLSTHRLISSFVNFSFLFDGEGKSPVWDSLTLAKGLGMAESDESSDKEDKKE
jgi:hypothetical protein